MIWFPGWSVVIVTRIAIAVHTIIIPTISTRILTTIHTTCSSVGSSWVRGRHTATAGIATFGWASPLFTIAMCSVSTPCVLLTHYSSLLLWFHWSSWGGLCHFSLCECLLLRIRLWILQANRNSLGISLKSPFTYILEQSILIFCCIYFHGSGESSIMWNHHMSKKFNTYMMSASLNRVLVQHKVKMTSPSTPPTHLPWNRIEISTHCVAGETWGWAVISRTTAWLVNWASIWLLTLSIRWSGLVLITSTVKWTFIMQRTTEILLCYIIYI